MEEEIVALKNNARLVTEIKDQVVQIDPKITKTQDKGVSTETTEIDVLEDKKEIQINIMKVLLTYRIDMLKRISQNMHSIYISLQGIEYQCSEALQVLNPLFNQWGPYSIFFDKLTHLLTQKKGLLKDTIVQTRKLLNKVKDLNSFFARKL